MSKNSIHLDGVVDSCALVKDGSGKDVAAIILRTMHPRPGVPSSAKASERFEMLHHRVVVPVVDANRGELSSLASSGGDGVVRPYSIDGVVTFSGGDAVVVCSPDGLSRQEKVRTSENNSVTLTGRIRSVSNPGQSASFVLRTKDGDVRVFVSKDVNQAGWRDVTEGKFRKGDTVSLTGPLFSRMYTDGKSNMRVCTVSARTLTQLKLTRDVRRKTGTPSL